MDIEWIKISVDMFNSRKFKQIKNMPNGDTIMCIWIELLCLAGALNNGGMFYLTKDKPYTIDTLAVELNRDESVINEAIDIFIYFEMLEILNGVYFLPNWEKYQNIEQMEKIREQNRMRKQRQREAEKIMSRDSHVTVTQMSRQCHAIDKDKEEDKEEDKEYRERVKKENTCKQVTDLFNQICTSYPPVKVLSDARKKAINARLNRYSLGEFTRLFEKAEASDFLKGKNNRDWIANFDWLIKDSNMAKVLDGNYDNKQTNKTVDVLTQWLGMEA